jgi:homopolymeric O-antigen transport system permease protein
MSTIAHSGFELQGESTKIARFLRDLWRSRFLIRTLAKKDFFVKYRRASIGMLWAVGLPLIQAIVLAVIFSRIARFQTPIKYSVYAFSGTLPWGFFSGVVGSATTAIVDGSGLATKIYFPRAVLPMVVVASTFHGFLPALVVLVLMAAVLGVHIGIHLVLLIPAMALMIALSSAFALVFAPLHVYFRDMRYLVQAALLPWFWASGVIFPLKALGSWRRYFEFNPVVGMLELFRASLSAAPADYLRPVLISVVWVLVLWLAALPLYRRYDRVFVDLL